MFDEFNGPTDDIGHATDGRAGPGLRQFGSQRVRVRRTAVLVRRRSRAPRSRSPAVAVYRRHPAFAQLAQQLVVMDRRTDLWHRVVRDSALSHGLERRRRAGRQPEPGRLGRGYRGLGRLRPRRPSPEGTAADLGPEDRRGTWVPISLWGVVPWVPVIPVEMVPFNTGGDNALVAEVDQEGLRLLVTIELRP